MGIFDKMKDLVFGSEEYDEFEDVQENSEKEEAFPQMPKYEAAEKYEPIENYEQPKPKSSKPQNVVDFSSARSTPSRASTGAAAPKVVVTKLTKFEEIGDVAKSICENHMAVINLEDADNATTQRIIDFIYGVSFATKGELKRVAYRTYIVKPAGYDYTGAEGLESTNMDGIVFGSN